jgi:hypothetical protein
MTRWTRSHALGRARAVGEGVRLSRSAKKKLLEFLPSDDRFVTPPARRAAQEPETRKLLADEFRRIVWTFIHEAPRLAHGLRVGEMTSAVTPWQHQVRTYTRFLSEWPSRVLIADEVGLGKTISAGLILRQAILSGLAKRVLNPDAEERPDSVAERTVREVQSERPDLRRRGAGVEGGAWRAERRREARWHAMSGRPSRWCLSPVS